MFVIGLHGSGKTTQCIKLDYEYYHISIKEEIQNEINKKTYISELINSAIEQNRMIPTNIIISLLLKIFKNEQAKK